MTTWKNGCNFKTAPAPKYKIYFENCDRKSCISFYVFPLSIFILRVLLFSVCKQLVFTYIFSFTIYSCFFIYLCFLQWALIQRVSVIVTMILFWKYKYGIGSESCSLSWRPCSTLQSLASGEIWNATRLVLQRLREDVKTVVHGYNKKRKISDIPLTETYRKPLLFENISR